MNQLDFERKYARNNVAVQCFKEGMAKEFLYLAKSFGFNVSLLLFHLDSFDSNRVFILKIGKQADVRLAKSNGYEIVTYEPQPKPSGFSKEFEKLFSEYAGCVVRYWDDDKEMDDIQYLVKYLDYRNGYEPHWRRTQLIASSEKFGKYFLTYESLDGCTTKARLRKNYSDPWSVAHYNNLIVIGHILVDENFKIIFYDLNKEWNNIIEKRLYRTRVGGV